MSGGALATRERSDERRLYRQARRRANRRIVFFGHALVWGTVCALLLLAAGVFAAGVVALAWGGFLVAHGFFFVVAPELRRRWVEREVAQRVESTVTTERRALEGKHSRSVEELAASVAHEIRNPITAAKSLVQQIGEDPTSTENAEFSKVAVEELDRVEKAVAHLLRYAREEPLRLEPTDVLDVIDSALETLRDRIDRTGVTVGKDIDGQVLLDADADKLRRIVINLVGNALDAFEESEFPSPRVELSAGTDLSGNAVWLRVRDNGPGIEADRREEIFKPFKTSKEQGTGLGLAITKKLVEAHGGSIEVCSELGAGTEMAMTFPRYAGEAPAAR